MQTALGLLCVVLSLFIIRQFSRYPYPRRDLHVQPRGDHLMLRLMLGGGGVVALQSMTFGPLVSVLCAAVDMYAVWRITLYQMATAFYYRSYARKPIGAVRALITARYYLRAGQAMVKVYRQKNHPTYWLRITNAHQGNLVHVRLKPGEQRRLLQALAAQYPYPHRLRYGWEVSAIEIWHTPRLTPFVRHRVSPVYRVEKRLLARA